MTKAFTYWQDGDMFLGYLNDYPEYPTQGGSLEELKFMLKDIYASIRDGDLVNTAIGRHCDTLDCA